MAAAQTLANVAAAYVLNAEAREHAVETVNLFRDRALHDPLTGLANRALLYERLAHVAARAQRTHHSTAVIFADLDRFKQVNDTYGHATGDQLLTSVASRLSAVLRPGDTLARVSGDEFVILCEDLAHESDAELLLTRIRDAFARPFVLGEVRLYVSASLGLAYAGPGEKVSDQLVIEADSAMYQAKRNSGATRQLIDLDVATRPVSIPTAEQHDA
jgi:diguanylate cyclase (GGDEF)-like protein